MTVVNTIDLSAWVGAYPFRGIARSTCADLTRKMEQLHIGRSIVSPFEAIFWENGVDAFREWHFRLRDDARLEVWPVINAVKPGAVDELKRLVLETTPRGLRLLPNYHRYSLADPAVAELMEVARINRVIVQVFQRIADERWHWMLHMPPVPQAELEAFAQTYRHQPLLISGSNITPNWEPLLAASNQLFVDISRLRYPVFAVEELIRILSPQQVVFGSLWPIQITEATLWQVTAAHIPVHMKQNILHDNAQRLLRSVVVPDVETNHDKTKLLQGLGAL